MTELIYILATGSVSLVLGLVLGRIVFAKTNKAEEQKAKETAALIMKEAEINADKIKRERILEAKEKFLKMKSEFEEDSNRKKNQLISNEQKLKQREKNTSKQLEQIRRKESDLGEMKDKLTHQLDIVNKKKEELEIHEKMN